jgi:hypothetical protein
MEKLAKLMLGAWNSIKSGSLAVELAQNSALVKISIDSRKFQVDIIEPKAELLQALKAFIPIRELSAKFGVAQFEEIEKLSVKEKWNNLKLLLKSLEAYAQKLSLQNKNFVLKYKGKDILVIGSDARAGLLKLIGIEKIALPHRLAFLKFIKEMKG